MLDGANTGWVVGEYFRSLSKVQIGLLELCSVTQTRKARFHKLFKILFESFSSLVSEFHLLPPKACSKLSSGPADVRLIIIYP